MPGFADDKSAAKPARELDFSGKTPMKLQAQDWLVDGLLKPYGLHLLAGHSGLGKTELILRLCHALDQGHPHFLGQDADLPARSRLLIQNDMDKESLCAQMWRLQLPPHAPCDIAFDRRAAETSNELRDLMLAWSQQSPQGIVIIDTFTASFLGVNQNSATEVTDALKALQEWHPHGPIIVSHHCNKPSSGLYSSHNIRGSAAFYELADRCWQLSCDPLQGRIILEASKRGPDLRIDFGEATQGQIDRAAQPGQRPPGRPPKDEDNLKHIQDIRAIAEAMQPSQTYSVPELADLLGWDAKRIRNTFTRAKDTRHFHELIHSPDRGRYQLQD